MTVQRQLSEDEQKIVDIVCADERRRMLPLLRGFRALLENNLKTLQAGRPQYKVRRTKGTKRPSNGGRAIQFDERGMRV